MTTVTSNLEPISTLDNVAIEQNHDESRRNKKAQPADSETGTVSVKKAKADTLTFESLNLHPFLLKALTECGYLTPTPIQAQAIPLVLTGQDVIASAQTGTGKTAAFLLPALHNLLTNPAQHNKPRILVLSPTRELAQQIEKSARDYSRCIRMSSVCLVGGMPYPQQMKALSRPLDLVIATPGRLMDHIERGRLDLSEIDLLVLDEADRMLDMGFVDDVKYIAAKCNKQRQTMLFSATIDRQMEEFSRTLLKNPARIKIDAERTNNSQIQQSVYLTDGIHHKMALLSHILSQEPVFKGIIFTATKSAADDLADALFDEGHKVAAMHGDMKQTRRIKTLEQLRNNRLELIVATDVAARGIDVSSITHVFNFDMPKFAEDYVHRIGRTGRAGQSGKAITFISPNERGGLQKIEKYIGQSIAQSVIEGLEPKARASAEKPKAKRSYGGGKPQSGRGNSSRSDGGRSYAGGNSSGRSDSGRGYAGQKSTGYAGSGRATSERSSTDRNGPSRSDSGNSYAARGNSVRNDTSNGYAARGNSVRNDSSNGYAARGNSVRNDSSNGYAGRNSSGRNDSGNSYASRGNSSRAEPGRSSYAGQRSGNESSQSRDSAGRANTDRFAKRDQFAAKRVPGRGFDKSRTADTRSGEARAAKPTKAKLTLKTKNVIND